MPVKKEKLKTVHLIDASIYIFRAYFSLPDAITNSRGNPANAVYGYASFLSGLLTNKKPKYVAAMFDQSLGSCFRNKIYPGYKASRNLPDPDLARQLNWCQELTDLMGIKTYASKTYEADDLIGTTAHRLRSHGFRMIYVTADKDLGQLIGSGDRIWDYAKNEYHSANGIKQKFGIRPNQLADFLGLSGDSVDDIPGVPGIGEKTASALLNQFGSMEKLYQYLEFRSLSESTAHKLRGLSRIETKLREFKSQAMISKELATISLNANIRPTVASVSARKIKTRSLKKWLQENGFGNRLASRLGVVADTTV